MWKDRRSVWGVLVLAIRDFDLGKKPVHEVFRESCGDHSRPRVWKRLKLGVSLVGEDDDAGRRQLHDHLVFGVLFMTGRELAKCHGVHEPTPSGLHGF